MMEEVYVVTSGEYSDYRINAVFTDKASAEAHAREFSDNGQAETWPLITTTPQRVTVYGRAYRNGTDKAWTYGVWDYDLGDLRSGRPRYSEEPFGFRIQGTNKSSVDKAFRDRLAAGVTK